MAVGAGVAPAGIVAPVAGGRHAVSGGGLRAGNGLPPLVRAAAERDRGSNDRGRVQKRLHGTTLLPSPAATLAWPSREGYAGMPRPLMLSSKGDRDEALLSYGCLFAGLEHRPARRRTQVRAGRSEEHTSELQSRS